MVKQYNYKFLKPLKFAKIFTLLNAPPPSPGSGLLQKSVTARRKRKLSAWHGRE